MFTDGSMWCATLVPHSWFALLGQRLCFKREDIQDCLLIKVIDNHVCKVHEFPNTCQCFHIKPGAVQIPVGNKSHASPSAQQQSQVYWIKYSHGAYSSLAVRAHSGEHRNPASDWQQFPGSGAGSLLIPLTKPMPQWLQFADALGRGLCTWQGEASEQPQLFSGPYKGGCRPFLCLHSAWPPDAIIKTFFSGCKISVVTLCSNKAKRLLHPVKQTVTIKI